jgi:hypothetical protein
MPTSLAPPPAAAAHPPTDGAPAAPAFFCRVCGLVFAAQSLLPTLPTLTNV